MNASGQLELLAALGYAVFERIGEGSFQLQEPSPDWLPSGSLTDAFPFLEVFLPDAEEFWANPGDRPALNSDFWTQAGRDGGELHFCAIAARGERLFLLIECSEHRFQQARSFVQYAHEMSLARDLISRLSDDLERASQAKSEFLARMSHEIRTPMNSLLGIAELLSDTPLNDEQSEYVRMFRRAGDNLLSIVNDILDFSKVEAGQIVLETIPFDVAELVEGAVEIAAVGAQAKGLKVSSAIRPGVPARIIGDPGRLRQILLNLLGNAAKFTERGELSVLVEVDPEQQAPGGLHFSVSDTGIGIPADRLSTIFDSFSQADVSTTRKYGGTGLGLTISRRFVELMGGRIWAESTLGVGSTMHFTAKFSVAGAMDGSEFAKTHSEDGKRSPILRGRALRILLADDSAENRFLIRGYLKDSGCILDEVENGAQAVEHFQQRPYDVVLMDGEMPVLDGYSATRAMRAHERERGSVATPILALTAHALREARDRSLEAGCTEHLTKPIKRATLFEAIEKYVPAAATDRIQVPVEAWLKPVVGGYLEKRRADIEKLRAALDRGDYATIRTLGHQMAGTGGGYGFDPITEIGNALEEYALAGDSARLRPSIDELERYLQRVQVA